MKRVSILSIAFVILSSVFTFAQVKNIATSMAPPPSGKGYVGQTMEFKSSKEATNENYKDFQWTLSFPTNVTSAPNPPTGSPYTWVLISPNNWQTTIPNLADGEFYEVSIVVNAIAVTTAGAEYALSQLSGFFEDDNNGLDDFARPPFFVEASLNTITVTTSNPTPTTGSQVTLTASGCTGGVYQNWTPAGGIVTGTGNIPIL